MRLKLIIFLICTLVVVGCRRSDTGQGTNTQTSTPEQTSQTSPTPATSPVTQTAQPSPSTSPTADSTNVRPKVDACAMLTSKDIEPIQGEAVKETKLSGTSTGGFNVSQCFFTLPTFTNSISLAVTQRGDGPGARDPRQFWKDTFHREEREKGREREKEREGEEKEESPPQKVTGIGEEAFWTASRAAGALYVLKGNNYVRVSVGGPGDHQSKLKKSKALARKVIDRL